MKVRNKYNYGKTSKERRKGISKYLILCSDRALQCSPIDFGVPQYGGKRTTEEQQEIYFAKWSKCDGIKNKSFHQTANALDLVPYIKGIGLSYEAEGRFGIIGMLMLEAWEELQEEGKIPKNLFLHWGGLWSHKDPKKLGWDMAHFEIREYVQIEQV